MDDLIQKLRKSDWVEECKILLEIQERLMNNGKPHSLAAMVELTQLSRPNISKCLSLARGVRAFPEILSCKNKSTAYNKLLERKETQKKLGA